MQNRPRNKSVFCLLWPWSLQIEERPTTCKLKKENRGVGRGGEVVQKDKYWQTGSWVCVWLPNWTGYFRTEECLRPRTGLMWPLSFHTFSGRNLWIWICRYILWRRQSDKKWMRASVFLCFRRTSTLQ